ncbi:MAG: plasmid mobilization relaxosome protein MobC [Clostridia bacterium]|nr:plasmid mobilization relaxosome protein MobC [Clostridia bacterium]
MTSNKTHNYKFRVDDDENFLIERKFSESGLSSKSDFFRRMILDGYVITADGESLDKLTKLFGIASNNINQIALVANRSGNVFKEDIDEIKKELNEVWQQLNYIRSKIQKVEQSLM